MTAALSQTAADSRRRVLVIDDEPAVVKALCLLLEKKGFAVSAANNAREALALLERSKFDVILTDIIMPEISGVELLRQLRRHDLDVPVILMTAGPTLDTALEAIAYGAQQYLLKPVEPEELVVALGRAAAIGEMARLQRAALASKREGTLPHGDRAALEEVLSRAFETISVVFQPIVTLRGKRVFGYEALMRCDETLFSAYGQLFAAADRIGWRGPLEQTIYQRISSACAELPEGALLFVNIHPHDATDGLLVGSKAPLEPIARHVVLEVSEHVTTAQLDALAKSAAKLRGAGYRIAVDDLGTGPAGLAAFTLLSPEFAKLDRTIFAGLDSDPARGKMVRAMYALCRELDVPLIAEGVETAGERAALAALGADLAQGNIFGKPSAGFAPPQF
jgi:EAL domain-containing protein (putative c-di-GMP-specific phosphodiesterase class I)